MIKTTNVTYNYSKTTQLSFPNIAIESGESIVISGESGSGKTTLLHLLAGLMRPTSGTIRMNNEEINSFTSKKMDQFRGSEIGLVFQQSYFIESLTVIENLLLSPYAVNREKAKSIAERLQINNLLNRFPKQLSVGQKQRVTIARALMNQPKLILADEPTSALDNKNCSKVIQLLHQEAINNNAALIVVSHDARVKNEINHCIELDNLNLA
ncbi:ABC transporter ATP-binding protein [Crocinitomix catalasitica]|uniref:ABC transporter ATP-binding protein n=1 Tax=Crocinitomix catalasitica TaxID=184607 RepID=UPI000483E42E|nr:ATP-binding cassette domain-containing protein [Crocinitomix catalasitica]